MLEAKQAKQVRSFGVIDAERALQGIGVLIPSTNSVPYDKIRVPPRLAGALVHKGYRISDLLVFREGMVATRSEVFINTSEERMDILSGALEVSGTGYV